MSEKCAEHVINCADFAFRLSVLGGGVGARKTEVHAILVTKVLKVIICIFFPIVTLELFYFSLKLGIYKVVKVGKRFKDL